jgi:hypothetical protein
MISPAVAVTGVNQRSNPSSKYTCNSMIYIQNTSAISRTLNIRALQNNVLNAF